MGFFHKLDERIQAVDSLLCVGLDPHSYLLSEDSAQGAYEFCAKVVKETQDFACCYKPNIAFFEVFGPPGLEALKNLMQTIPRSIPVLLDCKRGDIGSTAKAYAKACYDYYEADGVTVSAYMGRDSVDPFLEDASRGVFVLCKTSNPSSNDLQTLITHIASNEESKKQEMDLQCLYMRVARLYEDQQSVNSSGGAVGLVIGSTDVSAIEHVRSALKDVWILSPGTGEQGGNLVEVLKKGLRSDGKGILVAVSRSILQSQDMKKTAMELRSAINEVRNAKRVP